MRTRLRSTLFRGAIGSERLSGSAALLAGYGEGFAFSAEDGGGLGSVTVKDADTPANVKTNVAAHNLITQSGTSPKLVKQPDGTVAWSPHNLAWYTEELASWTSFGAATTVTDDALTYNGIGLSLVDENATATNNYGRRINVVHNTGATYALRFYAKKDGIRYLQINASDAIAYLDLDDNHLENTNAYFISGSVTELTDGVVRVDMTYTSSGGNDYLFLNLTTTSATSSHAGVVGDGMYLGGVQVNREAVQSYIANSGSAAVLYPAFEWDASPDTGAARWRAPDELAATNLATYASDFTNAAWVKTGGGGISAAKTATGPDGVANSASTLTASGANGTALQAITSGSSARVTSVWMKRRTGSGDIDLTQDNGGTWTTQAVTSTWTRFALATVTSANPTVGIRIVTSGDEVDVWVFQHETGTVVTSSIPAFAATAMRTADAVNFALSSIPHSASAETIVWRGTTPKAASAAVLFQLDDGTANERIRIEYTGTNVRCVLTDGGSATATLDLGAVAVDTDIKIAFAWTADDVAASVNGGAVVTDSDTSGGLPAVDTARLGYSTAGERGVNDTDSLVIVPQRLSDAKLQALTA